MDGVTGAAAARERLASDELLRVFAYAHSRVGNVEGEPFESIELDLSRVFPPPVPG